MKIAFYVSAAVLCLFALPVAAQPPQPAVEATVQKEQGPPLLPPVTWAELQKQFGGPTLVTLHVKEMPALQVIDELSKQSPVPVRAQQPDQWGQRDKKTFSGDYEKQPFWLVVREIAQKLQVGLQNYGQPGVTFVPWQSQSGSLVSTAEPCIFDVSSANYGRYAQQGPKAEPPSESLSINGNLYVDPKLHLQSNGMAIHLDEAIDDKNQSCLPTNDSDIYSNSTPIDFNIQIKPPALRGGHLKRLRGAFHAAVAFQSQKWEVSDVLNAKNAAQTFASGDMSNRFELQDATKVGDAYRVTVIFSQSGKANTQQMRLSTGKTVWMGNDLYNKLRLVDDTGHDLQARESSAKQEGDEQTRITTFTATFATNYNGEQTGPPAKLVLDYATDWRELTVPFTFENVNLP